MKRPEGLGELIRQQMQRFEQIDHAAGYIGPV